MNALTRLFARFRPTPAAPAARRTRTTLAVTGLEARETPAALASFNPASGLLTVTIDQDVRTGQTATIGERSGVVYLNSRSIGVSSAAVRSIVVNGSTFDNAINLTEVSSRGFSGLDGRVTIHGGGGRDTIYGSQFADTIRAGEGNDRVFGGLGGDAIAGDGGNDQLYGDGNSGASDRDGGNDTLDGGTGDDDLNGGGGSDTLIGGAGRDTFWDSGITGRDMFWVDAADVMPRRGWAWAGAESHSYGRPPRV